MDAACFDVHDVLGYALQRVLRSVISECVGSTVLLAACRAPLQVFDVREESPGS